MSRTIAEWASIVTEEIFRQHIDPLFAEPCDNRSSLDSEDDLDSYDEREDVLDVAEGTEEASTSEDTDSPGDKFTLILPRCNCTATSETRGPRIK